MCYEKRYARQSQPNICLFLLTHDAKRFPQTLLLNKSVISVLHRRRLELSQSHIDPKALHNIPVSSPEASISRTALEFECFSLVLGSKPGIFIVLCN